MTTVTWRFRDDPEQRSARLHDGELASFLSDLDVAGAVDIGVDPVPDVGEPMWGGGLYVVASPHHEEPQRHGAIGAHLHMDFGAPCGEMSVVLVDLRPERSGELPQHTHHLPRCDDLTPLVRL